MKKTLGNLILPAIIVTMMFVLVSTSFMADNIITQSYRNFLPVFNQNQKTEYILIIDPGHGGADGGAVSVNNDKESKINLDISKRMELFAAFLGITTKMTRSEEEIQYPDNCITIREKKVYDSISRVEMINSYKSPILISIHQNKYEDSAVSGAQVFYKNNVSGNSEILAENITEKLDIFANKLRGTKEIQSDIYIFKHTDCTSILVECGYISNPDECNLLKAENYQNKLAIAIITGYNRYINENINVIGGTNEI